MLNSSNKLMVFCTVFDESQHGPAYSQLQDDECNSVNAP
jgi:hypothetical protein